jgi:tetratricopeptide (TPR) repeat protein
MGLDALQRLPPTARGSEDVQATEARLETDIGYCYGELREFADAFAVLKSAEQVLDRLAAADPMNSTTAFRRLNMYRTRAQIEEGRKSLPDAIADYRKTIAILDGMIATNPAKASNRLIRAESQARLAKLLASNGQMAEATRIAHAGIGYLDELAERPTAPPQSLNAAAEAHLEPPIPALVDNARVVRYAQRSDQLAQGKDPIALFYLAQGYENLKDGPRALEAIQRFGALIPATPPGQPPSQRRLRYEKHLQRIQYLIKMGHLPEDR